MNRILLIFALILFSGWGVQAQTRSASQPIEIFKKPLGEVYQQDGKTLNTFKLSKILRDDRQARNINRQATGLLLIGIPTTLAGGLIMAAANANLAWGGETDWLLFSTGASTLIFGTSLNTLSIFRQRKAVMVYNENLAAQSYIAPAPGVELQLVVQRSGLGLGLQF